MGCVSSSVFFLRAAQQQSALPGNRELICSVPVSCIGVQLLSLLNSAPVPPAGSFPGSHLCLHSLVDGGLREKPLHPVLHLHFVVRVRARASASERARPQGSGTQRAAVRTCNGREQAFACPLPLSCCRLETLFVPRIFTPLHWAMLPTVCYTNIRFIHHYWMVYVLLLLFVPRISSPSHVAMPSTLPPISTYNK